MTAKTKIFNLNYKLLFLKGVNESEEKRIAKELLYFLDNYKLDENLLLTQIEKEDWYKLKYKKSVEKLTDIEKEEVLDIHIDFIVNSCVELLNKSNNYLIQENKTKNMILKPVYMNTIELQNKIFIEFKEMHHLELTPKELNDVIEDYIKECEAQGPMTTWDFVQNYLDKY